MDRVPVDLYTVLRATFPELTTRRDVEIRAFLHVFYGDWGNAVFQEWARECDEYRRATRGYRLRTKMPYGEARLRFGGTLRDIEARIRARAASRAAQGKDVPLQGPDGGGVSSPEPSPAQE